MENLIKALQIFLKYGDTVCPTHCEHDELMVMVDPSLVTEEDLAMLQALSFEPHYSGECFVSNWYGSA